MKKHVLLVGIFSALLMTGCTSEEGSSESKVQEQEQKQDTSSEVSAKQIQSTDQSGNEVSSTLESPYKEIGEYFTEWELPEGGREGDFINGVTYENGYTFDKDTKLVLAREWGEEGEKPEPTEEQKPGVIMGLIVDAHDIAMNSQTGQTEAIFERLEEVHSLNDFEPLQEWLITTESFFSNADYLKGEESLEFYDKGVKELQKIKTVIMNVEDDGV